VRKGDGGAGVRPGESGIGRREMLRRVGTIPVAAGLALSSARVEAAQEHVHKGAARASAKGSKPEAPKFFTPHEWATVRVLADIVIPADERSGAATDALVPEFIDFVLGDPLSEPHERELLQTQMRGGLAWLDRECRARFSKPFVDCAAKERTAVLDDIAWPEKARPEMYAGAAFFIFFRDLVASGFWSSKVGVEDLEYSGNTFVAEWKGCPPEVLAKIGLPSS
jgi:gluconate 2-dehydrogenase gamma chain